MSYPRLGSQAPNLNLSSSENAYSTGDRVLPRSMSNLNSPSAFGQRFPFPMENEMQQQSDLNILNTTQEIEDKMQELGQKLKHIEGNINYLRALNMKLDGQILDANITLGNYLTSTPSTATENEDGGVTEKVIIKHILKYEKSAAALVCQMKYSMSEMSDHSLIRDVIGVVAILGSTTDTNLSSILSEYLGLETMLAVVCRTSEGVKALEAYNKDGSIDKNSGLHAFAANVIGVPLDGRFQVICLENLRAYPGKFMADDPYRRLDLVKPVLQGETPTGFLGFAVNMVSIDDSNMFCMSRAGNTLRETLFYNLFSSLQVYRSGEDMLKARPVISNGAVSLDGGAIGRNGAYFMGQKRDIDVMFPIRSSGSVRPEDFYETETRMKEIKWKKSRTVEELQKEQEQLYRTNHEYKSKRLEYVNALTKASLYASQVGRVSTPR